MESEVSLKTVAGTLHAGTGHSAHMDARCVALPLPLADACTLLYDVATCNMDYGKTCVYAMQRRASCMR